MRRRLVVRIGLLGTLLCLWTGAAHALTFSVTDDTYAQQNAVTSTAGGTATSLIVGFTRHGNTTFENITFVNFEPLADLLSVSFRLVRVRLSERSAMAGG